MSGQVRVVVPWRPDGGTRSTLWAFCRDWWRAQGVVPVESPSPDGPFNRSAAINAGLAGGEWDVGVVLDADVIGPDLEPAIALAIQTQLVVFPFETYHGLAPWGMREVLRGADPTTAGTLRVDRHHQSSVVVIPRRVFIDTEGFDETFVGWGQDDVSFAQTTRVLHGEPLRTPGVVYHLWHEVAPEKDPDSPLWQANQRRGFKYREATTREAIEELMWERRIAKQSSSASTPRTHGTASEA